MDRFHDVTLAIDIMFFDHIPFMVTISRDIHFYTVEKIENWENATILNCLMKVISIYEMRGFSVKSILGDGEFRHMIGDVITQLKCHPQAQSIIPNISSRAILVGTSPDY